jgi:hypothetical protein
MNTIEEFTMQRDPRQEITIGGKKIPLLFTPSMMRRELREKAALDKDLNVTDGAAVWAVWVKIFYLSYLNHRDTRMIDGTLPKDEPKLDLADFEVWASGEGRHEFADLLPVAVYFVTGHPLSYFIEKGKQMN